MKITNIVYDSNSEDENEMFFFCRRCEGLETQIDFVRDKRIEEDLFIAMNLCLMKVSLRLGRKSLLHLPGLRKSV